MAFSARAMRFITISKVMRKLAGALIQTVVPILTVLGFCKSLSPFSGVLHYNRPNLVCNLVSAAASLRLLHNDVLL